ncbi:MAG: tRNA (adenosine(37)-N6)-threonylcarbamoyltransferase complex dimerization subunit type 1 TsaB [Bacteroidales bacterium]|nr:tRNA (adenosine(37)-N6)-threonylcarbamoyltransferase complex dimerization subunit type 1 TsaB [Bacteroidales bacterium]
MATILNIDTSTTVCSVALTADGMVIHHLEDFAGMNHATLLSGFIKDCLDVAASREMKLDAIAVSFGPGSYTGLRIGLSEAKGLAYALNIPLIGIDTLMLMAVHIMFNADVEPDALFAPMIDARRMEVYTAVYDLALNTLTAPTPLILEPDSYDKYLNDKVIYFGGNGSDKAREVIKSANARWVEDVHPLAVDMGALADRAYLRGEFLDLAYSTPNYLKEFQATKPKSLLDR